MIESSLDLEILPEWVGAAEEVLARPGIVVLLGASDSGKTTLCRILAERWQAAGRTVGLVDGDIGQASIGPPATIGLAMLPPDAPLLSVPRPRSLCFVGSTSPSGHLLSHILGTQTLVQAAIAEEAEIVLVDTTGLISGEAATSLNWYKLQAIQPQHMLALQRQGELEPILRSVGGQANLQIHRLPVSAKAARRSHAIRRAYREERFRQYFVSASPHDLAWKDLRFSRLWLDAGRRVSGDQLTALGEWLQTAPLYAEGLGERGLVFVRGAFNRGALRQVRNALHLMDVLIIDVGQLPGTLLGLHDRNGRLLALGILQDLDLKEERLRALAPLEEPHLVAHVAFGSFRIDTRGRELGQAPWRGSSFPREGRAEISSPVRVRP